MCTLGNSFIIKTTTIGYIKEAPENIIKMLK